nr:MAG TPA: hypothetical protein [Bacteriophage sp.]
MDSDRFPHREHIFFLPKNFSALGERTHKYQRPPFLIRIST